MRKRILTVLIAFSVAIFAASQAAGGDVAQGRCINFDKDKMIITIEEYDTQIGKGNPYGKPTGAQSAFEVRNAKIGIPPQPGDILRIAYISKGTEKTALKVMNVSKQDLRKK
jgi:hypothetical protein